MMRMPKIPEAYARALGVHVRYGWVPDGLWGTYDADLHIITLKRGLAPTQLLCTLMHELGHAAYRHTGTTPRYEREANYWAAVRLISKQDFVDAILVDNNAVAIAHRLGVLPDVVEHYIDALTDGERQAIEDLVRAAAAA